MSFLGPTFLDCPACRFLVTVIWEPGELYIGSPVELVEQESDWLSEIKKNYLDNDVKFHLNIVSLVALMYFTSNIVDT